MATLLKISIMAIAITLALAVTITIIAVPEAPPERMANSNASGDGELMMNMPDNAPQVIKPSKRINRFLEANKVVGTNPRASPQAADHCKRDNTLCDALGGKCCHNKCMDLSYDKNNCGTCMNKCKFTHRCCRGECVMIAFDKRHCGKCDNRCPKGQYCVYGMCNYG